MPPLAPRPPLPPPLPHPRPILIRTHRSPSRTCFILFVFFLCCWEEIYSRLHIQTTFIQVIPPTIEPDEEHPVAVLSVAELSRILMLDSSYLRFGKLPKDSHSFPLLLPDGKIWQIDFNIMFSTLFFLVRTMFIRTSRLRLP